MCNENYEIRKISALGKTWILDLDGTIVKHNGYKLDGKDTLLEGVAEFFANLSEEDKVVFLTSRKKEVAEQTERFLKQQGIHYDAIVYEMPYGERILVNDRKPSGLETAIAVNTVRDEFMKLRFDVDEEI